ncbi:MAG: hypothetical protein QXG21_03375, partial [Candidatus Caldarchaeum sp.]
MNPLTLLADPSKVKNIDAPKDIRKALLVFTAAAISQILISLYVFQFKTVHEIALGPYSRVELRLFQTDYLVMSSLVTVFVALVIFVGVGRIFGRFLGKTHSSMRVFLTAFLYLFSIFAIINVLFLVSATFSSPQKYYVFGAEFREVVFRDASLTWVDENGVKQAISSDVVYARKANITRVDVEGKAVQPGAYSSADIEKIIQTTVPLAFLEQPLAPPHVLPEKITVESFEFKELVSRNIVLNSIALVSDQAGGYLPTLSVVKNFLWRVAMSVYAGL